MNPINAKSVQLIELHAFAYCLLSVSLSESFDFLKVKNTVNQEITQKLCQNRAKNTISIY